MAVILVNPMTLSEIFTGTPVQVPTEDAVVTGAYWDLQPIQAIIKIIKMKNPLPDLSIILTALTKTTGI